MSSDEETPTRVSIIAKPLAESKQTKKLLRLTKKGTRIVSREIMSISFISFHFMTLR